MKGDPDPQLDPSLWIIGPSGLQSYFAFDLLTPEPVPLGVKVKNDEDEVQRFCEVKCTPDPDALPGDWTASWSAGPNQGGFVDLMGNLQPYVADGDMVLYVPPQSLTPGETRSFTLRTVVYDLYNGPFFEDGPLVMEFDVLTTRNSSGKYSVSITSGDYERAPQVPTYCYPPYNLCCGLVAGYVYRSQLPGIYAFLTGPGEMTLGEARPFTMAAYDKDTYHIECGHNVVNCTPASDHTDKKYNDSTNYEWELVSLPPGYTPVGDGSFLFQDIDDLQGTRRKGTRTSLFRATRAGYVSIRATARGSDGEEIILPGQNDPPHLVYISSPALVDLAFLDGQQILQDNGSGAYLPPHWSDVDLDGIPETKPVAYRRNARVGIQFMKVAGPSLPGYDVACRGNSSSDGARYSGVLVQFKSVMESNAVMLATTSDGAAEHYLPNAVTFYSPYHIDWSLLFDQTSSSPCGASDNRLYCTLEEPIISLAPLYFDTVYDFSCQAAHGAGTPESVEALVFDKVRNGIIRVDGTILSYWSPSERVVQDASLLMSSVSGSGSCKAFAQFLWACFGLHAIAADLVQVRLCYTIKCPFVASSPGTNRCSVM